MSNLFKAMIMAVTGFICFAVSDVIFKSLAGDIPIYGLTFFTGIFATLGLLLASPVLGGIRTTLRSRKIGLHLLRGFILFAQFMLAIYALQNMAIAKVYTLIFLYPFFTVIFDRILFKEVVSMGQWAAIAAGFAGVIVILRPGAMTFELAVFASLGVAVLVALCNHVMVRYIGEANETKLSFALYPYVFMIVCGALLWLPQAGMPRFEIMASLMAAGVINSGGMLFVSLAFSRAPAGYIAPFAYLQMVCGIILSYLFLDDVLNMWMGIGAGLIIASGLATIAFARRKSDDRVPNTIHP